MSFYPARRRRNSLWMGLSVAAAAFGLTWLFLILAVLFWQGFAGLSFAVFTQMTPPPGSAGGLLNAIAGSLIMTVIGVAVGTPLGMLAGTYLAEYGRYSKLSLVVRFINDILLSAPSIVIGLFVYQIVVAPMGHFSGVAGSIALAVLVVPVVVRTTEDMLSLVPNSLREAGAALGMPRSLVIQRIGYRAARAGLLTGVLLAIARVSGETAPLLFTSLEQPVLELEPQRADVEPAGGDLPVCAQPVQAMATARLDRRFDHHARRARSKHLRARPGCKGKQQMNSTANTAHIGVEKLSVRGLQFYYGQSLALKNITLPLYERKVTAFIGPSGCGKSTLLRVLNRMYDLYPGQRAEGEVLLDGENILAPELDVNLLRARIGMVFQKPTPFPMTIYDNIAFGIRLYEKLPKSELDARVESALRKSALWGEVRDKLNSSGLSLSGGQQQRLCIARSVAISPEVILLDEPASALDPISTAKIEELIDELKADYTIAIVTHNMQQAARVSQFTAFMYLGEMVEFDETSKVFTSPRDKRTQDYITGRFG